MYLNTIQVAESFGVPESVVDEWVESEGLPVAEDRGRRLFDRMQVVRWATRRGLGARAGFLVAQHSDFYTQGRLEPLLRRGKVWRKVKPARVPAIFDKVLSALPGITEPVLQLLQRRIRKPGGIVWSPMGNGITLPHPSAPAALGPDSGILAVLLLEEPFMEANPTPDNRPVDRMLFFVAPSPRGHVDLLGRISRALAQGSLGKRIMEAAPTRQIIAAAAEADETAGKRGRAA